MIRSALIATVVAAAGVIGGAQLPAQAQQYCDYFEGHQVCATAGVGQDHITVRGPQYRESGTVTCRNYRATDWSSNGNMTQAEASEFFTAYCSGRGNT